MIVSVSVHQSRDSLWILALLTPQDMWVTVLNLLLFFFCLWINSLPLNVASSFDLLPFQGGDQTFSDVFQHWKTKLVSFLEAGCGILEMNSSLVVLAACCDPVWEPPCASLLVWSTGRVCTG